MRAASAPLCAQVVDASRHAAHNQQTPRRQIARQHLRNARAVRRGMPRAHHCDRGALQQLNIAAHPQHRRRIVDLAAGARDMRYRRTPPGSHRPRPAQPTPASAALRPLPSNRNCDASAENCSASSPVSDNSNIRLGAASSFMASRMRLRAQAGGQSKSKPAEMIFHTRLQRLFVHDGSIHSAFSTRAEP